MMQENCISSLQDVQPEPWLDISFFQKALALSHPDINAVAISPAVCPGENYMSTVFRAKVTTTSQGHASFIIKCKPSIEFRAITSEKNNFAGREIMFYKDTLPLLTRGDLLVMTSSFLVPHYYYSINTEDQKAIVLKDLKPEGFTKCDRTHGLDATHCMLALEQLAHFHALSISLRARDPITFQTEITEKYPENQYSEINRLRLGLYLNTCVLNLSKIVQDDFPFRFRGISNIMRRMSSQMFQLTQDLMFQTPPDPVQALVHNDFWCNNLLFKYGDQELPNQAPTQCCVLDFQVLKCGSPVIDLLYFFYTSTTQATRRAHMEALLQLYIETVRKNLRCNGVSEISDLFYANIDELKADMSKYQILGFGSACFLMPIAVADVETCKKVNQMDDDKLDQSQHVFDLLYGNEIFKKRFREVLEDFDDVGFFKQYENIN